MGLCRLFANFLFCGAIALLAACGGVTGTASGPAEGAGGSSRVSPTGLLDLCGNPVTTAAMVDKINGVRRVGRRCGARFFPATKPLAWNDRLARAASQHAVFTGNAVAAGGDLSHTGAGGSSPADRVAAAGYDWQAVGENIAGGQGGVDEVFANWIGSPEHCSNLMSADFTEYGFACAINRSSRYGTHWVQVFAKPF